MQYQYDQRPNTVVTPRGRAAIKSITESEYSVLVGRNNCGKSFLLKTLTHEIGSRASYLGPARYQNFNILGYYTPNRNKRDQKWREFESSWSRSEYNIDNSPLNLQQAIAELSDRERANLEEIVQLLLGTRLEILQTVSDNSMSQKYVSCDGHNISYTSSGFRLITTIVTSLLDTDFDTFLIDEPELGVSPEAQGILSDFLFDRNHRANYFPHIKTLVFATHSTIFLDRLHISNNYSVYKKENEIDIVQAQSITEFNRIHFFLLGNRLESLYLPACIVLTEGKCDHAYITRTVELIFPKLQFSVINAGSDGRMKEIISIAGNLLTDLQKSPYRTRIIAILDKTHGRDVVEAIKRAGVPAENVLVWSGNGIEYVYPEAVMDGIFGDGPSIRIEGDLVSRNGVHYKKWELCEMVVGKLTSATIFPDEMQEKFLKAVERVCDVSRQSPIA